MGVEHEGMLLVLPNPVDAELAVIHIVRTRFIRPIDFSIFVDIDDTALERTVV